MKNAGAERHSLHDKPLYICYQLTDHDRSVSRSWHIHAVNLSHLLLPSAAASSSSSSVINSTTMLRAVTQISDHDLPDLPGCGVFGSKILFAGGRFDRSSSSHQDFYVFETVDPKLEIKKACFPSFVDGEKQMLLMELDDGKLYAVSRWQSKPDPPLMAFDPREGIWSALPDPPSWSRHPHMILKWGDVCCATVGTDILVSSPLYDPKVLYCFDAAARRWTKRSTVDPLISSGGRALVLNCDEDDDDGGFIMFTYSCMRDSDRDSIQVYHMSKEYEHLRHIESHQMPHHDQFPPARQGWDEDSYSFVHLGGRQVCLVLGSHIWHRGEGNRLTIVVVMFEYAMADKNKKKKKKREEPISKFNFLTTRLFRLDHLNYTNADMLGAFVVPPPQPAPVVLPNT